MLVLAKWELTFGDEYRLNQIRSGAYWLCQSLLQTRVLAITLTEPVPPKTDPITIH